MTTLEKIMERADFWGVSCENFLDDIRCICEERSGREGKRKNELFEILKNESQGIRTADIADRMNISKANVSSLIMELRKSKVDILNINGLMILSEFVNIG